jgi:hypothetical protein
VLSGTEPELELPSILGDLATSCPVLLTISLSPTTMEVPFVDSGALSRTHYTLVRNVENASSPQAVDEFIFSQIDSIRDRLRKPSLSFVGQSPFRRFSSHGSYLERMQKMSRNSALLCNEYHCH